MKIRSLAMLPLLGIATLPLTLGAAPVADLSAVDEPASVAISLQEADRDQEISLCRLGESGLQYLTLSSVAGIFLVGGRRFRRT